MTRDAHDGWDSPKKTTKGPKSGLKKENHGILTILLLGTRRVRIRASRIQDSEPDLNPDPGI
jgi:hypothetical protein